MKDASKANRGRPFEELIASAHKRYQMSGLAVVHKVPTAFLPIRDQRGKIVGCKVEEKSCVDYLGRYRNIAVAVEAKHTQEKRIAFDQVEDHQAAFMDDWTTNPGAVGIVIVSFRMSRFFAIPWPFWAAAREQAKATAPRRKPPSVSVTYCGEHWNTPTSHSAAPDDLLPEWEYRPGGKYLLPYLDTIERLARKEKTNGT